MHLAKNEIPIKENAPGAVARQKPGFRNATGYGKIGGEYFAMDAETDIAPLLQGLEDHLCHELQWGYLIKGVLTVSCKDGEAEETRFIQMESAP